MRSCKGLLMRMNMLKKLFLLLIMLLCLPVFALAAGEYDASCEETHCEAGEKVAFTLTLPETHGELRVLVNGQESALNLQQDEKGTWTEVTLNEKGENRIQFVEYTQGKETARFPKKEILVFASLQAPLTYKAYVTEHDMATVSAVLPGEAVRVSAYGFEYGETADALNNSVKGNRPYGGVYNKLITGLEAGKTYYYRAYVKTAQGMLYGETLSFTTLTQTEWSAQDAIFETPEERYMYLFGDDTRCPVFENAPKGYNGSQEAWAHIVTIEVPVWRIVGNNGRAPGTTKIQTNRKLAGSLKAIFEEIYALEMQFPIHYAKSMSYRRINGLDAFVGTSYMSHHSFGSAIDINYHENLFYPVGHDNRDKNNPYTIPDEVIEIFERYGWSWGGYFLKESMPCTFSI